MTVKDVSLCSKRSSFASLKTFTLVVLLLATLSSHLIPVASAHQLPGNLHRPAEGPDGHVRGYGHGIGHGLVGRKHGSADKRMMRRVRGKGKVEPDFGLVKKGDDAQVGKRDESEDLAGQ